MKIEVNPNGVVKIDTEAAQAICGVFPIHCEGEGSTADHTAVEIGEAIDAGLLPVLFVKLSDSRAAIAHFHTEIPNSRGTTDFHFKGFSAMDGCYLELAVDPDGKVYLPR